MCLRLRAASGLAQPPQSRGVQHRWPVLRLSGSVETANRSRAKRRERSTPPLFDPSFDLVVCQIESRPSADITKLIQCLGSLLDLFGRQSLFGAYQPRDWLAVAGNDELVPLLDLGHEVRKLCFCFKNA